MYQYVMIGIRYGVYSVLVCILWMIQCYWFIMEGIIKLFCYGVYSVFYVKKGKL